MPVKSIYAETPWPSLSQGDLFSGITIREYLGDTTKTYPGVTVVLLSHDCEIDKPATKALLCAQTRSLAKQSPTHADTIRRGGSFNAMYLPAIGNTPESYIDFRLTHRVHREIFDLAVEQGTRVTSMTQDGRDILMVFWLRYFTRAEADPRMLRLLAWGTTVMQKVRRWRDAFASISRADRD